MVIFVAVQHCLSVDKDKLNVYNIQTFRGFFYSVWILKIEKENSLTSLYLITQTVIKPTLPS